MASSKTSKAKSLEKVAVHAHAAANALKAMASEPRLMILCALSAGERPVNQLADLTGQSQSAVSQHLAKLRAAGLVESRREGQMIYYRCRAGIGHHVIDALCSYYGNAAKSN